MNTCTNHPERDTYFSCHNCGRPFCSECLTEYGDYYYCHSDECRRFIHQENINKKETQTAKISNEEIFTGEVICPSCSVTLDITEEEQKAGNIICPECGSKINVEAGKTVYDEEKKYAQILTSVNLGDIAIIKSLFEEGNIDYYILGENFLTLNPLLQPVRIFVLNSQIEDVKEILKNFEPHIFGVSSNDYDENENEQIDDSAN